MRQRITRRRTGTMLLQLVESAWQERLLARIPDMLLASQPRPFLRTVITATPPNRPPSFCGFRQNEVSGGPNDDAPLGTAACSKVLAVWTPDQRADGTGVL